jgi:hypothetical protein
MACIRIERDQNGYSVTATDPKIAEANRKQSPSTVWVDPEREYQFKTCEDACEFVKTIAEKALPLDPPPPDPFAAAFKEATEEDTEEKEDKK